MSISTVNIRDINPLEHITADITKTRHNYEAILNGLVNWASTDNKTVTVRLATDTDPGFVDYTFPSRKSYSNSSEIFGTTAGLSTGGFDVGHRISLAMAYNPDSEHADLATLRLSVPDNPGFSWEVYEDAAIHEEQDIGSASTGYASGIYFRVAGKVYITASPVSAGGSLGGSQEQVAVSWVANRTYVKGTIVRRSTFAAMQLVGGNTSTYPEDDTTNWIRIGDFFDGLPDGYEIVKGRPYVCVTGDNEDEYGMYLYVGPTTTKSSSMAKPVPGSYGTDPGNPWYGPVAFRPVSKVKTSTVLRHSPTTDLRGFILKNVETGIGTGEVYAMASMAVMAGTAAPHSGLDVFSSCNYQAWPASYAPAWESGKTYTQDDDHSAAMVFHYADDATKATNIVNYDGPDLDEGLRIYLPVIDRVSSGSGEAGVKPEDGSMMEFMFRIWPNTSLNGKETADLTVNKAQIYVYSLPDSEWLTTHAGDAPTVIAKFSMARVTNFYVWAENVAIPNRPVFYKARFIYSASHGEWKTYDYYQVPDHVFLAPRGFVDPSLRGPDDGTYPGMETAGFPLMQDPFGGMDMRRLRMNRIED